MQELQQVFKDCVNNYFEFFNNDDSYQFIDVFEFWELTEKDSGFSEFKRLIPYISDIGMEIKINEISNKVLYYNNLYKYLITKYFTNQIVSRDDFEEYLLFVISTLHIYKEYIDFILDDNIPSYYLRQSKIIKINQNCNLDNGYLLNGKISEFLK